MWAFTFLIQSPCLLVAIMPSHHISQYVLFSICFSGNGALSHQGKVTDTEACNGGFSIFHKLLWVSVLYYLIRKVINKKMAIESAMLWRTTLCWSFLLVVAWRTFMNVELWNGEAIECCDQSLMYRPNRKIKVLRTILTVKGQLKEF